MSGTKIHISWNLKFLKFRKNYSRLHLVFMFFVSQIHPFILQKTVIIFKVTHMILNDFKSF